MATVDVTGRGGTGSLAAAGLPSRPLSNRVWRRLGRDWLAIAALVAIVLVALAAAFAPLVAPYDPTRVNPRLRLLPPFSPDYLLGTDYLGRDILSRIIWGGRISLVVGIVPVLGSVVIGTLLGSVAGFYGGRLDQAITRVLDVLFAFPAILLALAIVSALGPSIGNAMLAITIVAVPSFARLVRAAVLGVLGQPFIEAARALGVPNRLIIARHVLPNIVSPVVVFTTLEIGKTIVFAAALGFLGLGVQPPTPEWGTMLSEGRNLLATGWHVATVPGLVIFGVSLSFNLIGDAVRDACDPKHGR